MSCSAGPEAETATNQGKGSKQRDRHDHALGPITVVVSIAARVSSPEKHKNASMDSASNRNKTDLAPIYLDLIWVSSKIHPVAVCTNAMG